ncbi:hypothetical protein BJ508DRAFT_364322 [Ascobolus immersus RN42]|uniref:Uncharacterized protein n=1 Tax=Ascobolus immersus RN42 TaxID=1160509 RepID=A0A3N4HWY6_ASCIM|nr:hypothetical protein BJ508DRAFT_364322 [Ascobolus immersus RN42]
MVHVKGRLVYKEGAKRRVAGYPYGKTSSHKLFNLQVSASGIHPVNLDQYVHDDFTLVAPGLEGIPHASGMGLSIGQCWEIFAEAVEIERNTQTAKFRFNIEEVIDSPSFRMHWTAVVEMSLDLSVTSWAFRLVDSKFKFEIGFFATIQTTGVLDAFLGRGRIQQVPMEQLTADTFSSDFVYTIYPGDVIPEERRRVERIKSQLEVVHHHDFDDGRHPRSGRSPDPPFQNGFYVRYWDSWIKSNSWKHLVLQFRDPGWQKTIASTARGHAYGSRTGNSSSPNCNPEEEAFARDLEVAIAASLPAENGFLPSAPISGPAVPAAPDSSAPVLLAAGSLAPGASTPILERPAPVGKSGSVSASSESNIQSPNVASLTNFDAQPSIPASAKQDVRPSPISKARATESVSRRNQDAEQNASHHMRLPGQDVTRVSITSKTDDVIDSSEIPHCGPMPLVPSMRGENEILASLERKVNNVRKPTRNGVSRGAGHTLERNPNVQGWSNRKEVTTKTVQTLEHCTIPMCQKHNPNVQRTKRNEVTRETVQTLERNTNIQRPNRKQVTTETVQTLQHNPNVQEPNRKEVARETVQTALGCVQNNGAFQALNSAKQLKTVPSAEIVEGYPKIFRGCNANGPNHAQPAASTVVEETRIVMSASTSMQTASTSRYAGVSATGRSNQINGDINLGSHGNVIHASVVIAVNGNLHVPSNGEDILRAITPLANGRMDRGSSRYKRLSL